MNTARRLPLLATTLLALVILPLAARAHDPATEMTAAANNFLAALSPEQKAKGVFELKSDERLNWHFIPRERKGLPIKEMSPAQRNLAHALLNSGLSQRGYGKAVTIMSLENVLFELEGAARKFPRDSELYFFSIFGTPGARGVWGWRVEGHHLSLNFSLADGEVTSTPSFMGTNPAEILDGPRAGLRVLAAEEDLARQLVKSLSADQKQVALYTNVAPKDIITMAERKVQPLAVTGVAAAKLNKEQIELLRALVKEYVQRNRPELADKDLAKIQKAGFEKIHFAWAGTIEPGGPHYYRVQGPTFLLEYDNTQNNANHIHAVWRDFESDFGEDILRRHYDQVPHDK